MLVPMQSLTLEKRMMQQRDRRRKHIEQAARIESRQDSLGKLTLGDI